MRTRASRSHRVAGAKDILGFSNFFLGAIHSFRASGRDEDEKIVFSQALSRAFKSKLKGSMNLEDVGVEMGIGSFFGRGNFKSPGGKTEDIRRQIYRENSNILTVNVKWKSQPKSVERKGFLARSAFNLLTPCFWGFFFPFPTRAVSKNFPTDAGLFLRGTIPSREFLPGTPGLGRKSGTFRHVILPALFHERDPTAKRRHFRCH